MHIEFEFPFRDGDKEYWRRLMNSHFVKGNYSRAQLTEGKQVGDTKKVDLQSNNQLFKFQMETLNTNYSMTFKGEGIFINNGTVAFKMENIWAKNGVIHIIENILVPHPLNKVAMKLSVIWFPCSTTLKAFSSYPR